MDYHNDETLLIRPATELDQTSILDMLDELELVRPSLSIKNFWVAEVDGELAGIAHLEQCDGFLFLSSVGVSIYHQHRGIATALVQRMISGIWQDVYLFTVIPTFFKRLGFIEANEPDKIPPRHLFGCDECDPKNCICMMRQANVS